MQKNKPVGQVKYRFTRVKDMHTENGQKYITLFGRLVKEGGSGAESVWVELEEVAWRDASSKLKAMPNAFWTFFITENVFKDLQRISTNCHQELYFLTPIHHQKEMRRLG